MAWSWKNGQPKLISSTNTTDTLEWTAGYSDQKQRVPQLHPNDSFRTLGIFISPSGSQAKQVKVLCHYAEQYNTQVSSSGLMQEAAYCSYMQYLRPRLTYPLPCSALTQHQCRQIQAPALAALLPKLHLNRHTPHAVLFGELRFGVWISETCIQIRVMANFDCFLDIFAWRTIQDNLYLLQSLISNYMWALLNPFLPYRTRIMHVG